MRLFVLARGMLMANCVFTLSPSYVGFTGVVSAGAMTSSELQAVNTAIPASNAMLNRPYFLNVFIIV